MSEVCNFANDNTFYSSNKQLETVLQIPGAALYNVLR